MQFMAGTGKISTQIFRPGPHTHTHDVKLCANFKFMHGKFAHAVKINDAATRKFLSSPVLGQLVDASDLLLASFVCQPACLTHFSGNSYR